MTTRLITRRELNRALLARQSLLERSNATVDEMIGHLVALQAQAPNAPYVGLWTRLNDFAFEELARLIGDRRIVRLSVLRNTIHCVTAADAHRLRSLLEPMHTSSFRSSVYAKQLVGVNLAAVAAAGRECVDEQPRTFAELGTVLSTRWPGRDPSALAQVVRAYVPLVQVPPRGIWGEGGQARHTTLEAWTGPAPDAPLSAEDLVLRYLGAFGPASVADVQSWSGLTRLGPVVDHLGGRLMRFVDDAGVELFDVPDAPRPDPGTPAPVRFMPEFDNILLGHADRRRVISDDDRAFIFTNNGIIPRFVLVDGFVAALWKLIRSPAAATLTVTPLRRLSKRHAAAVAAEGRRLLAVIAATAPARELTIEGGSP
jgi:hypothetical protein